MPDVESHTQYPLGTNHAEDPTLARLGTFSGGVYAFALTLLILSIRIPHPTDPDASAGLLTLLTQQWRSYLAYVLSFMSVSINWTNDRVVFSQFVRANHGLIWLHLLYLMVGVAFILVPTSVLGEWLGNPQNEVVAVFYGAVGGLGALLFNVLWWNGAYVAQLTTPSLSARERLAHTLALGPSELFVAAFTAIAFVNPPLAVTGCLAVVAFYVLPTPALVALLKRLRSEQSSSK